MTFKKLFLPIGTILAIITALILPQPGVWLKSNGAVPFFVVVIFLVSGWHLSLKELKLNKSLTATFSTVIAGSLLVGPFIGSGIAYLLKLSPDFTTGLIIMSSVPVTLSSATVITGVCGGNAALALFMTIGLNIVGIFTVPFMLKICLESAEDVNISAAKLLIKLLLLVLLPCVVGYVLKRLTKIRTNPILRYTPSTCVILTVFAACAASRGLLLKIPLLSLPILIFSTLAVHLLLMGIMLISGIILKTSLPERKAMMFVGSQKTLPLAISVLTMLPFETGMPLIICLIFHFSQLLLDSFLAAHVLAVQMKSSC